MPPTTNSTSASLGSRDMALFVLDCSVSMGQPITFVDGLGGGEDDQRAHKARPLDVMLVYVKAKIAQRIMRDLKTTPCGVITYAVPKTKNVVTNEIKQKAADEGVPYDKASDVYRHYYEHISIHSTPSRLMLEQLDLVQAGLGPDGYEYENDQVEQDSWNADAHNAILVAIKTLEGQPKYKTYQKNIYLLTDGESKSDWNSWKATANEMNLKGIGLTVVGMNFDDDTVGYTEDNKSSFKRENELYLRKIVDSLEQPSTIATATRALGDIAQPTIKVVNSTTIKTTLSLGDVAGYRETSILMRVEIKKAVVPAPVKTMKQMSMRGFEQSSTSAANASANTSTSRLGDDHSERQDREAGSSSIFGNPKSPITEGETQGQSGAGGYRLGKAGKTFDKTLSEAGLAVSNELDSDLMTHAVLKETRYFYRPIELPEGETVKGKEKDKARMQNQAVEEDEEAAEEAAQASWRPTGNAQLTDAYYYGGSLVDVGGLEPGVGELQGNQTGMEFIGFMKRSDIRYDWRMGDVLYVYPQPGYTGSQLLFSALLNGMLERKSVGIVRYVGKGMNTQARGFKVPDPKIGLLWPEVDPEGQEFCYWCQMPFSEDLRVLAFPSLDIYFNGRGERVIEHPFIPTQAMDDAMEKFVDAMDLVDPNAEAAEASGTPASWFNISDSYSPAIHNINNTLIFRLSDAEAELPPVPASLVKYLDPPPNVVARSRQAREAAISAFDVKRVPPKPKKINKKDVHYAGDEPEATVDFERIFSPASSPTKANLSMATHTMDSQKPKASSSIFRSMHDMDVDLNEDQKPLRNSNSYQQPKQATNNSLPPSSPPESKPIVTPAHSPYKEVQHIDPEDDPGGESSPPEPDTDED